jgi:hypothetical protein
MSLHPSWQAYLLPNDEEQVTMRGVDLQERNRDVHVRAHDAERLKLAIVHLITYECWVLLLIGLCQKYQ